MEASVLGESRQFTDKTVHRQGFSNESNQLTLNLYFASFSDTLYTL